MLPRSRVYAVFCCPKGVDKKRFTKHVTNHLSIPEAKMNVLQLRSEGLLAGWQGRWVTTTPS